MLATRAVMPELKMKVKTSTLTGQALDFAAFLASGKSYWSHVNAVWDVNYGYTDWVLDRDGMLIKFKFDDRSRSGHWERTESWEPSTDWAQGGPIIEREVIGVWSTFGGLEWHARMENHTPTLVRDGPTPLIAAMRYYVASRLGDEVEVPEELVTAPAV